MSTRDGEEAVGLVGVGQLDQTCPPAGVDAAANQLSWPRELVTMPTATHGADRDAIRRRADA